MIKYTESYRSTDSNGKNQQNKPPKQDQNQQNKPKKIQLIENCKSQERIRKPPKYLNDYIIDNSENSNYIKYIDYFKKYIWFHF